MFLFARALLLVKISTILEYIGGIRVQKSPKKDYFEDAESVRETLEIFNQTNINVVKYADETYHDYVSS